MAKIKRFGDASGNPVYVNMDLVIHFADHVDANGRHWTTLHFSKEAKLVVQGEAHQLASSYA